MSRFYCQHHTPIKSICILAILFLIVLMCANFDDVVLRMIFSFMIVIISITCFYISDYLKHKTRDMKQIQRIWKLFFLFFLLQLAYLLFFDPEFSRDRVFLYHNDYIGGLREQWQNHTNFIPFQTIRSMWSVHAYDGYIGHFATLNIIGNIIAFVPFAFFLPMFSDKYRSFLRFLFLLAVLIAGAELIQFFTLTGTMDIDDFILNYAGVAGVYILCYGTPIRTYVYRLFHILYQK